MRVNLAKIQAWMGGVHILDSQGDLQVGAWPQLLTRLGVYYGVVLTIWGLIPSLIGPPAGTVIVIWLTLMWDWWGNPLDRAAGSARLVQPASFWHGLLILTGGGLVWTVMAFGLYLPCGVMAALRTMQGEWVLASVICGMLVIGGRVV
ncbi:MAG: hypothetical protein JW850_07815 [Thermoflexales bacterium]|nr:hypothetical protein [Thermoflexales bacterium]